MSEHSGGCLCGAVAYEAEGEPKWIAHCHCQSCRRHTGSVLASFVCFRDPAFRFTKGEPGEFESSPGTWRRFCRDCGTPLTFRADRYPGETHVFLGTLNQPDRYVPTKHVHFGEHIDWFNTADDLPRFGTAASKTTAASARD